MRSLAPVKVRFFRAMKGTVSFISATVAVRMSSRVYQIRRVQVAVVVSSRR